LSRLGPIHCGQSSATVVAMGAKAAHNAAIDQTVTGNCRVGPRSIVLPSEFGQGFRDRAVS
jgi:hypothetical protein